ncbi:MAG: HigA family addiction module antidote protein [Candidatus Latescibacteria bacterium]|nr:HigA family addiction module antidote protein [Candidatus Latescibacterota bacterium]
MAMEKPPHPGLSIVENWLDPLCLTVTDAARVLGVARHTLSRVLNGHAAISPEMAIRLEKAGWSDAEYWLRRQTAYDLLQARQQEDSIEVERYQPQPTLWEGHGVYRNTNIALLLGAGASVAAGFPTMQELTDIVVSGRGVTRHSDGCFYIVGGDEPGAAAVRLPNSMVSRLLDEAKPHLTRYVDRTVNYEDIYFLARQAVDEELGETENPAICRFVDSLRADWPKLIRSALGTNEGNGEFSEPGVPDNLGGALWESCNYIADVVRQCLLIHRPQEERLHHLNAIEHACKAFNVTSISTLCHDTHVETYLKGRNIALADGFSVGEDDISFWNGDLTSEVKIPFLKLHGSVDWYRYRDGKVRRIPPKLYPQRIEVDGGFLYAEDIPRLLLIGTFNKLSEYGSGIFRELHHRFRSTLGEANTVVVCGYSFGDKGINNEMVDWYFERSGRRFVIVHPEAGRLVENARGAIRKHWDEWKRNDSISIIEKRFEEVEAPEFVETIAQRANG